ncbi:MAG: hypothetical protein CM1200mP30_23180 [Pseudomonadota bacterium]|nr:MAG: hypothetical protein CM1200mP30_23180 [Pseudomonadota bacterium]
MFDTCNSVFSRSTGCTEGNCENGYGTWTYTDLTTYVGEWRDGKKHGKGTVTWPNGYIYEGEFQEANGMGRNFNFSRWSYIVGEWRDSNMNGQGTFSLAMEQLRKDLEKRRISRPN